MRRLISFLLTIAVLSTLSACGNESIEPETTLSAVESARNDVIEKWTTAEGIFGTSKFIEDIYKQYPDDEVIANIYYYCIAKELYGYYESMGKDKYLTQAIEYAEKIDPEYSGEFANEIHMFVDIIIPDGVSQEKHNEAEEKEDKYNSLTNKEKKEICQYIESRYEYYDKLNGVNSGDKYSDTIMEEAAQKYGLTVTQVEIIWMNMYSY